MTSNHAVVWIDHAQAHVIHFTPETSEKEVIKTHSTHPHLHTKAGVQGSGHAPESPTYFDDVANALKGTQEILIVGPGNEKLFFLKNLQKKLRNLSRINSNKTLFGSYY